MNTVTRPPPRILYVTNKDSSGDGHHLRYLAEAGLKVAEARSDTAVSTALSFLPDIIVLDFDFDGDIVAALQAEEGTKRIPVIALAKLTQKD